MFTGAAQNGGNQVVGASASFAQTDLLRQGSAADRLLLYPPSPAAAALHRTPAPARIVAPKGNPEVEGGREWDWGFPRRLRMEQSCLTDSRSGRWGFATPPLPGDEIPGGRGVNGTGKGVNAASRT